jgi:hypothetical protein
MRMPGTEVAIGRYLQSCGYRAALLRTDFQISDHLQAPLVAFARLPADARSSCIAVVEAAEGSSDLVAAVRDLGAPIVFVCGNRGLEWWKQGTARPERNARTIPPDKIPNFFADHANDFRPDAVYRAKTWGRFDRQYQLGFVDLGLMPLVEGEIGRNLEGLIVRNVQELKGLLDWDVISDQQGHWLLTAVFWLVSAKILRDKEVGPFKDIDPLDVEGTLNGVAAHFGTDPITVRSKRQQAALEKIAGNVAEVSSLQLATTESLAHVYENALISRATRHALGTHSTPPYLVDYIVGKLAPWIADIPVERRNIFEPACGHSAFLVSAMRLLTELLPDEKAAPSQRRSYLRTRIHGIDLDAFAIEIARLSLSLTDIPNPNGWDLSVGDIFIGNQLEAKARSATIFLTNPPFENFRPEEKSAYAHRGAILRHTNKTTELLARVLPELPPGSVVGAVVPQGFLHSKNAASVRRLLTKYFEIQEICLFPDKVFTFSDMESAVLIARKKNTEFETPNQIRYRRVREREFHRFKQTYSVTTDRQISSTRFTSSSTSDLRVPDLEDLWTLCEAFPRLGALAVVGQGLSYKGKELKGTSTTFSKTYFRGAVRGFMRFEAKQLTHELPLEQWLSVDSELILRKRLGTAIGIPQILLNQARSSRGVWRLKALLDRDGHAVSTSFNVLRPKSPTEHPLEFFWAILNSPLANAYLFTHSNNRNNDTGILRRMPVPQFTPIDVSRITTAATHYLNYVSGNNQILQQPIDPHRATDLSLRMDNEVLRMYNLPRELEWQLLRFCSGWKRDGVPFSFDGYFPADFLEPLSLDEYLSITEDWPAVNRRRDELICKKVARSISTDERTELGHLQKLATSRKRLLAPLCALNREQDAHHGKARHHAIPPRMASTLA